MQSACSASPDQLWALTESGGSSVIRSVANLLRLDLPGASNANATKPVAWTCNGGTNQTWRYAAQTTQ